MWVWESGPQIAYTCRTESYSNFDIGRMPMGTDTGTGIGMGTGMGEKKKPRINGLIH